MGSSNGKARRSRLALIAGATAAMAVGMGGGVASAAIFKEGGHGRTLAHPGLWLRSGKVCLSAGPKSAAVPFGGCGAKGKVRRQNLRDRNGKGVIRLGSTGHYMAAALVGKTAFSVTRGIRLSFSESQYGGDGGDGIAIFFQNGDLPIDLGTSFNGHEAGYLGYMPRNGSTSVGLPNALGAVAIDNYGYFSDASQAGSGCHVYSWRAPHTLAVRGPGHSNVGYCPIVHTRHISHLRGWTRKNADHAVVIQISPRPSYNPRLIVKLDGRTRINIPLKRLSPSGYSGATLSSVSKFRIGFGTASGRVTDLHELWNIQASYAPTLGVTTRHTPAAFRKAGQKIHYRFTVLNNGADAVHSLRIRHGAFQLGGLHCNATSLASGKHTVCTATHRVTARDVKRRRVVESVIASAVRASGRKDASLASRHIARAARR